MSSLSLQRGSLFLQPSLYLCVHSLLQMGEKFADGASGEVFRAAYKGEEVAVKVLRGRFGSSAQVIILF